MIDVNIEITEDILKQLVVEYLCNLLGDIEFEKSDIMIQTKSKQNYKSEWEVAAFKAVLKISKQGM